MGIYDVAAENVFIDLLIFDWTAMTDVWMLLDQ